MRSEREELTTEATPCREEPGVVVEAAADGTVGPTDELVEGGKVPGPTFSFKGGIRWT